MNIYFKKEIFEYAVIFFFGIAYSLMITPYYTLGDQEHYIKFYENAPALGWVELYLFQISTLSSYEPGYYFFVKIFSPFFEKEVLFSVLNGMLLVLVYMLYKKTRLPKWYFPLILFNFYLLGFLTVAIP